MDRPSGIDTPHRFHGLSALCPASAGCMEHHGHAEHKPTTARSEEGKLVLQIRDFLPPDCSDRVEARLLDVPGVRAASLNPMMGTVTVTLAPEGSSEAVVQRLREIGDECGARRSTVQIAEAEHRAHATGRPAEHDHNAMMEQEMRRPVLFLLFGHWMEMRSVRGASGALRELVRLIPPSANRVKADGSIEEVETALLALGDVVLVRPGEKVPIDGVVLEGASSVNEALVTGESKPVSKGSGDNVLGGTINGEGALPMRVTKTGEETGLAQIVNLVRGAQESKPRGQRLADP